MNFKYNICVFQTLAIIIVVLLISVKPIYSQVYNYTPIIHNDIETNPAILASPKVDNRVQLIHQNSFSSINPFSFNSLRLSKYFESSFLGLGLSLNNTNLGSFNYNHIGIGAGYRNVLFNKVYLKLGATYKLVNTNSPSGIFDYYSFTPSGFLSKSIIKDNVNLALSFTSSPDDRSYVSFGLLNLDLPWGKTNNSTQFPKYYVLNVGNLMTFFDRDKNSEISYTAFGKLSATSNKIIFSQYINLKFNLSFSRKSSFQYGSKIGFTENAYYHFIPFITYYRRKFAVSVSYNLHLDKVKFNQIYYSTAQINITYIL